METVIHVGSGESDRGAWRRAFLAGDEPGVVHDCAKDWASHGEEGTSCCQYVSSTIDTMKACAIAMTRMLVEIPQMWNEQRAVGMKLVAAVITLYERPTVENAVRIV